MSKQFYLYKITNLINNKAYIGKSNFMAKHDRWYVHCKIAKGGRKTYPRLFSYFHSAIKKYGKENFKLEIIETTSTEKEIFRLEKLWISQLKTAGHKLYNLTNGGEGPAGFKHSASSKAKIAQSMQGEKCTNAKLCNDDVYAIREPARQGYSAGVLARFYNVCESTILMISRKQIWTHLTNQLPKKLPKLGDKTINALMGLAQAREIRNLDSKFSRKELASMFNVTEATISRVVNNKIWQELR